MKLSDGEKAAIVGVVETIEAINKHVDWMAFIGFDPQSMPVKNLCALMSSLPGYFLDGSTSEWISWFCYDNEFGASGRVAGVDGDMRQIKSIDDLIWAIEL